MELPTGIVLILLGLLLTALSARGFRVNKIDLVVAEIELDDPIAVQSQTRRRIGAIAGLILIAVGGWIVYRNSLPPPAPDAAQPTATEPAAAATAPDADRTDTPAARTPTVQITQAVGEPLPRAPILDDFDDACLDRSLWAPVSRSEPRLDQPSYTSSCINLERSSYIFETSNHLLFTPPEIWEDGVTLISPPPGCRIEEVEVRLSEFHLSGVGWFGLIVDHPQRTEVISIWLGRFADRTGPLQVVSTSGHTPSFLAAQREVLIEEVADPSGLILSVGFDGARAYKEARTLAGEVVVEQIAPGYPLNFSLIYSLDEGFELAALIEAVHVRWSPVGCGLP